MRIGNCLATLQGLAIVGMLVQSACAGGGGTSGAGNTVAVTTPAQSVSVTLVGVPSAVAPGASVTVSAQVQGATSTAVTWTVDGMANGNASVGTISNTGNAATYTAPTSAGNHVLAAISVADPSVSASAQVTVSASAGPVISAVTASSITQTSALISWSLNKVGTGQVFYGPTPAYGSATTPELSFNYSAHAQNVTGLTAGTLYHYCVKSADQAGNLSTSGDYTFTTASATSSNPPASSITSVSVSPTALTLNPSAQFSFAATVAGTGTYSYGVTWSCLRGTITSGGLYTAPSTAGSDTVTATSVQDGTKTGTSSVTVSSSGSVSGSVPSGTSVKSAPYNAYGDGMHDDTAAIQACVSAIAGTGGTVVVPSGTYMINTQANSNRGVSLGSNMTFYISAGATLQAITTSSSATQGNVLTAVGVSNLTVSGPGTVKGDKATHTGPQQEGFLGISISGATNVTVSGPTFSYHFADGIYIGGDTQSSNITISGVTCDNNTRQGMSITNAATMLVTGCTFSNTSGTDPAAGIDIEPNAGITCSGIHITGCTFFSNAGGGLEMGPAYVNRSNTFVTGCLIENNEFYGNGGSNYNDGGIYISSCTTANTIQNNNVHNNLNGGITVNYALTTTVTGNTVTNNALWGIFWYQCNGSTIAGNTVTGNSPNFEGDSSTGTYSPNP